VLSTAELVVLAVVGLLAGAVNAVAGGGSLLTFPAMVAAGLPPLTANISNTIAQLPGYASVVAGYREELAGQGGRLRRLAIPTVIGAAGGVVLLERSSPEAFEAVVPWLVLAASGLLAVQPSVSRAVRGRTRGVDPDGAGGGRGAWTWLGTLACGAYGAYFGAAVGVVLLAVLAIGIADRLQRLNAMNRTLVLLANLLAAPLLALVGPVDWSAVAVVAPATLAGGYAGARVARRLPDRVLRAGIVTLGVAIGLWLLVR